MTKGQCSNCKNEIVKTVERRGLGENNVEYIKTNECKLGFDIMMGGRPGPRCGGRYFEPK